LSVARTASPRFRRGNTRAGAAALESLPSGSFGASSPSRLSAPKGVETAGGDWEPSILPFRVAASETALSLESLPSVSRRPIFSSSDSHESTWKRVVRGIKWTGEQGPIGAAGLSKVQVGTGQDTSQNGAEASSGVGSRWKSDTTGSPPSTPIGRWTPRSGSLSQGEIGMTVGHAAWKHEAGRRSRRGR
jgi:hypothetical protein